MIHSLKRIAAVAGLSVALGAGLAACHGSSSSSSTQSVSAALKANPALHQQLSAAEQQGVTKLKACLPSGSSSAVDAVMAGQASTQTAFQLAQAFQGSNMTQVLAHCFPGGHGHPVRHARIAFDTCFKAAAPGAIKTSITAAEQPYKMHPIKDRHVEAAALTVATSQSTVRVAAKCFAKITK